MVAELQSIHEQCEELVRCNKSLVGAEAEVMFHVFLAKHSGNSALWVILDFVNNILLETKRHLNPGQDFSLNVLEAHKKILKSIVEKDAGGAEKYMRLHIEEVRKELEKLAQTDSSPENPEGNTKPLQSIISSKAT